MNENTLAQEEYKGYTVRVEYDTNPHNPREWDNLGIMYCAHSKYRLGDEQIETGEFSSWKEVYDYLVNERDARIIIPLYLHDHSGLSIICGEAGEVNKGIIGWDTSPIGYIYATNDDIRRAFGIKRITKKSIERTIGILEGESEEYDMYLRGEVYGFIVEKDGKHLESVWGFSNSDDAMKDAKGMADYYYKQEYPLLSAMELHV